MAITGGAASLAGVAISTLLVEPLTSAAPVESLVVVYVPVVLAVASTWGGALGYATAVLSAGAFNWFHLPPTGSFTVSDGENWVGLGVFLLVAVVAGGLAERSRARARQADERRAEAALATETARLLLRGGGTLQESLPAVSAHLARTLELEVAEVSLGAVAPAAGASFALREGDQQIGTLLVDTSASTELEARVEQHLVPALQALLAAALERDGLLADVVETAALRRSDVLKTALLRAMSHDLRTPLTTILTAEEALRSPNLTSGEHDELVDDVGAAARRLARLVDKLLDLSRLEAESSSGRPSSCSIGEVLQAAADHLGLPHGTFRLTLDADLPEIVADPAQLERAFANLLENSARYSGGHPVSVRGRRVGDRVLVRIVDRGPGVPTAAAQRIFEPFFRDGVQPGDSRGAGLGLAIARGFVDANGGRVWAESVPGQGTTFVVEFPLTSQPPTEARRITVEGAGA